MCKTFGKHKILRNLTCFLIVLKHIQVDRRIILAFVSDKLSSLSYHNNCQNCYSIVSRFQNMQTLGKMIQVQLFCGIDCTHAKDNYKKVCY